MAIDSRLRIIEDMLLEIKNTLNHPQKPPVPEYMTRREVAEYLSCSIATVDNYCRKGTLRKIYLHGLPRFKGEDVRSVFLKKSKP